MVPPDVVEAAALARSQVADEDVPRFRDRTAPLAVLAAEIRRARQDGDQQEVSALSARLARQLVRRRIELREAIQLAERAQAFRPTRELAEELCDLWVSVGDYVRGASLLTMVQDSVVGPEKSAVLTRIALLSAHGGKVPQALQALHRAASADPQDPLPHELMGAMGFWADFPAVEASQAYLEAAELRTKRGQDAEAFQCLLRAFEVEPASRAAADALAAALRARGRPGAAEEITREHLRHGSAAARAAHHERRFHALARAEPAVALEAALEAELDLQLEPSALERALDGEDEGGTSFEAFLVRLAREDVLGDPRPFAELILALVEIHDFDWGRPEVRRIAERIRQHFGLPQASIIPYQESDPRELRQHLAQELELSQQLALRRSIARREAERGEFHEALEVLQPLLQPENLRTNPLDLRSAVLSSLVAGRARDAVSRPRALLALAFSLPDAAAAVIGAVASEALLQQGLVFEAATAAKRAVLADPASARALAAQALVALSHPDESTEGDLETSLSALVARGAACQMLARSAAQQGSLRLALGWSQRTAELRPGDPAAENELLERACEAGEPARLLEAVRFVLAQPLPLAEVAPGLSVALTTLGDLSKEHALEAARLVIETAGIRFLDCRLALSELAEKLPAPELGADVTERLLVLTSGEERPALLLTLARQRSAAGDPVAAARASRRALALGAPPGECGMVFSALGEDLPPDAELARMEARADSFSETDSPQAKAAALRTLGVARWDMAQDAAGAVAAWMRAADLEPELGLERVAHYVTSVAGADAAPGHLERAARLTKDARRQGRLLGLAARAMLEIRMPVEAFRLSCEALERAPLLTDLLAVAERTVPASKLDELEQLYGRVAAGALGRYGERAVHYRAARLLERRSRRDSALRHAALAFEAVPAEGVAFVLMARLTDGAEDPSIALSALQRVADAALRTEDRARWLEKAADLASLASGGGRQRVEILLRAAQIRPEVSTVEALESALEEVPDLSGEDRERLLTQFRVVSREAQNQATGAHGASLCIALSVTSFRFFDDDDLAFAALSKAVASDIEIPDYRKLMPFAERIAARDGDARTLVELTRRGFETEGMLLGRSLAELLSRILVILGDQQARAELLARAASDAPEDAELVSWARSAAEACDRRDLLQVVAELLPADEQVRLALSRIPALSDEEGVQLLVDLDLSSVELPLRLSAMLELAVRMERTDRLLDAAEAWRGVLELEPGHTLGLAGLERLASRREDFDELCAVLRMREEVAQDASEVRSLRLRRARLLDQELGRPVEAREVLDGLLAEQEDVEVLSVLAASHQKSGGAEQSAGLWLRARDLAPDLDQKVHFQRLAAHAFHNAGENKRALPLLAELSQLSFEDRELQLDLSRALGDRAAELSALVGLAELDRGAASFSRYLSAARLAHAMGEEVLAEDYARRGARGGPEAPAARLLASQLRFRREPPQDEASARQFLVDLAATEGISGASQLEIRAFLIAEATKLAEGPLAARDHLERALERQGKRALLCASLAGLLDEDAPRALELYETAIGAELHGLREDSDLLLEAARLAFREGNLPRARSFASAIGDQDELHREATKILEDIAAEGARQERAARERAEAEERERAEAARRAEEERERAEADERRLAEEEIVRQAEEEGRREVEASHPVDEAAGRLSDQTIREDVPRVRRQGTDERARFQEDERARREEVLRLAREEAARERAAVPDAERRRSERPGGRGKARSSRPPIAVSVPPEKPLVQLSEAPEEVSSGELVEVDALSPEEEVRAVHAVTAREASAFSERDEAELVRALERGDVDAGLELLERLAHDRARSHDAVVIAGHLAALRPGEGAMLGRLVAQASRDGNEALALSVRHVLGSFGAGDRVDPPPLSRVSEQPEAVRTVLWRGLRAPALEALSIVWEHASGFLKKDLRAYDIVGTDRVPLSAPTPLGELYRNVSRILALGRTPLFREGTGEDIAMHVALLSPPAVIVSGDVVGLNSELHFHFGAALAAATSETALLFASSQDEIADIFVALSVCFGGTGARSSGQFPGVTRLAALLWEAIPVRAQRRLSQLCTEAPLFSPQTAMDYATFVLRRAGLIACGDIRTAIEDACQHDGIEVPRSLAELSGAARMSPAVADLLTLAISPEFAELRFRTGR